MEFGFGLYSSLLLIFFLHGIVFSILILWEGITNNVRSNLWLSLLIFLLSLYISPFMLGYAGWYTKEGYYQVLFYLPLQQVFLIGPVLYFYVQSLTNKAFNPLRGREWLHLLPAALYFLYSLVIFIGDIFIFEEIYFYQDGQDKDLDLWYQVAGFFSLMIYFILSLWIYRNYKKRIYDYLSYAEEVSYGWVRRFLLLFLLLLVLRFLFFIINPEWGEFGRKFWYYLSISFVLYYLSIRGYKHSLQLGAFLFQNESFWEISSEMT